MTDSRPKKAYIGQRSLFMTPYSDSKSWETVKPIYANSANLYESGLKDFKYHKNYHYTETINDHKINGKYGNDTLFSLRRFIIDIDYHKKTKSDVQSIMKTISYALATDYDLPMTMIVPSGRGLHVHINIQNESYKIQWKYRLTAKLIAIEYERALQEILKTYQIKESVSIDHSKLSPSGVIRRVGSYNPNTNTKLEPTYITNKTYVLDDLFMGYGGQGLLYETRKNKYKSLSEHEAERFKFYHMAKRRVDLIERELPRAEVGQRNNYLFMLYHHLKMCNPTRAEQRLWKYNNSLNIPLSDSEVIGIMNYLDSYSHVFKFKDSFIKTWLGLPQTYLITKAEKLENKKQKNQLNRKLRDSKIVELIENSSMTYKEIAELFNLSLRTINNIRRDNNVKRYKK